MFEEKTISSEDVYTGDVLKFRIDKVELPDENIAYREILEHPGAVGIVGITNAGKIVLIKQYRKAIELEILEIPAGKLEKNEHPYDAAIREFEEEAGYKASNVKFLFDAYMLPGCSDAKIYFYIAKDLKLVSPDRDDDEFIEVLEFDISEIRRMLSLNKFVDAKTIIALKRAIEYEYGSSYNE